ncbi:hypothetical protein BGX27_004231, partial [Mortierella sp. AM989]
PAGKIEDSSSSFSAVVLHQILHTLQVQHDAQKQQMQTQDTVLREILAELQQLNRNIKESNGLARLTPATTGNSQPEEQKDPQRSTPAWERLHKNKRRPE